MAHNICIVTFLVLEVLAAFGPWIPSKINLCALGLAFYALSFLI
jgi:hypothetical protein